MLFSFAMAWDSGIEDRPDPFALILPPWVVGLRYLSHEGSIHLT